VYNEKGEFISNVYEEYNASRADGEHEIDASAIFEAVCKIIKKTSEKYSDLTAIGITTFGETFTVLDENDDVLMPSMLYTDPRGKKETQELCDILGEKRITYISGAKPNQMYSVPKIMWIKRNKPEIYEKIKHILLMEDFIVYKLTGKANIDYSLAARTMGFDIRNKCWSKEIFDAAGIDMSLMSTPVPTGSLAGEILHDIAKKLGVSSHLKIVNGCHDQIAAALGAGVFEVGQAVDGTGTVECITPMFDEIPENEQLYEEGYAVVPYVFDNTYVCYAVLFTGGAVLKWYRDNFAKLEMKEAELSGENVYASLDSKIPEEPTGILVMPHFAGSGNPYMDNSSKAVIAGLTLENTDYDFYKALMEGVTYEIMLNIEHFEGFGIKPQTLYATGGGASSPKWLQIKSDILNRPIVSLEAKEAGAAGTCMMVAVATGICKNLDEAKRLFVKEKKTYMPDVKREKIYKKYFSAYKKLYSAVRPVIGEVYDE